MKSNNLTAARVVLYVNGKLYGRVTDFRWNSSTSGREIYGIDSPEPFELANTTTRCSGSMSVLRLGQDGGAEGAGMTVSYADISREKYFSLALVDRVTDTIIFQARRCKLTSQSWDVPARGRVTGNLDFVACDWSNEATPAVR